MSYTSITAAVQLIQSGHTVFIHTAAATPRELVNAMTARSHELKKVRLVSIHTECEAPYASPEHTHGF